MPLAVIWDARSGVGDGERHARVTSVVGAAHDDVGIPDWPKPGEKHS